MIMGPSITEDRKEFSALTLILSDLVFGPEINLTLLPVLSNGSWIKIGAVQQNFTVRTRDCEM
jgi:hypothetical protein